MIYTNFPDNSDGCGQFCMALDAREETMLVEELYVLVAIVMLVVLETTPNSILVIIFEIIKLCIPKIHANLP